jgi:hypothetical protein
VWLQHVGGQFVQWVHHHDVDHEHPVMAVPASDAASLDVCDFCRADGAVWLFPIEQFFSRTGVDSGSDVWSACDVCWHLVTTNQWSELTRHVVRAFRAAGLLPLDCPDYLLYASLQPIWLAVRVHQTGSPVRIVTGAPRAATDPSTDDRVLPGEASDA